VESCKIAKDVNCSTLPSPIPPKQLVSSFTEFFDNKIKLSLNSTPLNQKVTLVK
jgi:hypothetical protein